MDLTVENYKLFLPVTRWEEYYLMLQLCERRPGTKMILEKNKIKIVSIYEDEHE